MGSNEEKFARRKMYRQTVNGSLSLLSSFPLAVTHCAGFLPHSHSLEVSFFTIFQLKTSPLAIYVYISSFLLYFLRITCKLHANYQWPAIRIFIYLLPFRNASNSKIGCGFSAEENISLLSPVSHRILFCVLIFF